MTDQEISNIIHNLSTIKPNTWYKLSGREDADNLIEVVKLLIDCHKAFGGDEYVIKNDYSTFMKKVYVNHLVRLSPWHKMQLSEEYKIKSWVVGKGYVWDRQLLTIHEIYFKKQLFAIETA